MNDLNNLAARVEALDGPDRDVDAEIATMSGLYVYEKRDRDRKGWFYPTNGKGARRQFHGTGYDRLPSFTASIDAAMTLVPEGAMRRSGDSAMGMYGTFFCDIIAEDGRGFHALAKSEPCAITAAALRAIAAKGEG